MLNFMTRDREQGELDELMRALGFAVVVAPNTSTRPIQPAWYQGVLHGRPTAVTIVMRKLVGWNVGAGTHPGDFGNRNKIVVVASVIMGAVGVGPVHYGLHTAFGHLPNPDPAALVPADHPAAGMPDAVRFVFHRFARGQAPPGEDGRSHHARYIRITNRSKIADYLPLVVVPTADVLVMHELPLDDGWQASFVPNTNELGWVAHALELQGAAERSLEG